MAFVSMKGLLTQAKKEHYAIPQFNINGLLWIQTGYEAAEQLRSPIILAASDRLIGYLGGFDTVYQMALSLYKEMNVSVPVVLHLDHGASVENCIKAINAGFSSVMYDGSHFPIQENIANTQQVCEYAKKYNVSVEAEVGCIGGTEDGVSGGVIYADFQECIDLVTHTEVDALAAALGSVHGKYKGEPKLGFAQMQALSENIKIPLVLHGASGIPLDQLRRCIELGHAKINFNTELIMAWTDSVRQTLEKNPTIYEPRLILGPARQVLIHVMSRIMTEIGSIGKG